MAKFRKRSVEVEAVLYDGGTLSVSKAPQWLLDALLLPVGRIGRVWKASDETLVIATLEGDITASVGDYIIRGIKGELYPCKPDIFAITYEPVEECEER